MSIHDLSLDSTSDDLPGEVEEYLTYVLGLAEEGPYQFAAMTLTGIADTIARRRAVTDAQRQAVTNIVQSVEDRQARQEAHRVTRRGFR